MRATTLPLLLESRPFKENPGKNVRFFLSLFFSSICTAVGWGSVGKVLRAPRDREALRAPAGSTRLGFGADPAGQVNSQHLVAASAEVEGE